MAKAERELGYRAPTGYAESLPATVSWLVETARGRDWRDAYPFFLGSPWRGAFELRRRRCLDSADIGHNITVG